MTLSPPSATADVETFIHRWAGGEGGQERANYALFLSELCDVIGAPRPDQASHDASANAYTFERAVTFREPDGSTSAGRIDLYKRGCFVLEAKQSRRPGAAKAAPEQGDLLAAEEIDAKPRGKRTATRAWDVLMMSARRQAEDYAKALPASEGWPPFLIVCDVGHCFEIYADFTGQGKNYAQFPDRQGFRIFLEDLRDEAVREHLRLIWLDPHKLDPTKIAARATRKIAERLAKVSKHLEEARDKHGKPLYDPEAVALFLMRCLFTMFAEDVELLPKDSFRDTLKKCVEKPELFPRLVGQLWEAMDTGGFSYALERDVLKFNGYLFKDRTALKLPREEIAELYEAAKADWRQVEPAIFGTLLEQALNPVERRKLGAHYTPRAYVERLVVATVLEPLKAEWANVQGAAEGKRAAGDSKGAQALVQAFQDKLCALRILDPACGTGNFLYVALELLKRLEGEVLEALANLGGQEALSLEGHTIGPKQFLGMEINPRAAAIAQLVIWIGFLQWHFRTKGGTPEIPIIKDYKTISVMDAVLAWDAKELARDEAGKVLERIDAEGARVELYVYKNPKRPTWPVADYIVGNPPFVGGKDIRGRMGDDYAQALWAANKGVNESADFVMYWWDRAAELLTAKGTALKRFGFVTTNSLSQVFQRRVMERHLKAKTPVSLLMAIPDHPWTKATSDAAAVRIAMTVAAKGKFDGVLFEVTHESGLDTDEPEIRYCQQSGTINSDLTVGVDVTALPELQANAFLGYRGMQLMGAGFIVTPAEAEYLGLGRRPGLDQHIRSYRNGRDLTGTSRDALVIDLFGLKAEDIRKQFPEVYQHVLETVKEGKDANGRPNGRDVNNRETYRLNWWVFGEPRRELRAALAGLPRYIATVETAKHRVFQFLDASILPDNRLVCFAFSDAYHLGILSSRSHVVWSIKTGGTLEDRPIYTKSRGFDPFPFPEATEPQKAQIRALAEELDALRKKVQAENPGLTLTQIYNVLEKLRAGAALDESEEAIKTKGLVLIVKELHEKIDDLVAQAYGWPQDLTDEDILQRLVALNATRAAEEKRGLIRWLRPDYQMKRAGLAEAAPQKNEEQLEATLVAAAAKEQKPKFPTDDVERTAAVYDALLTASAPLEPASLARKFRQGAKIEPAIIRVLASLTRLGHVHTNNGKTFTLRRRA